MRRTVSLVVLVATLAFFTGMAVAGEPYCGHGSRGLWRTETFVQTMPTWMYGDGKHRHLVMRSTRMGSRPSYVTPVCRAHR